MDDPKNPKQKPSIWDQMDEICKEYEESYAFRKHDLTWDQIFNRKPMIKYKITIGDKSFIEEGTSIDNALGRYFLGVDDKMSVKFVTVQEYSEQDEMLDKLKSLQAEMDMIRAKLQGVEYGALNKMSENKFGRTPDDGC